MIETAMKISEQFESFSIYTHKETQDIAAQIKQRKADCEAMIENLDHTVSKKPCKSIKDSTCVASDSYS